MVACVPEAARRLCACSALPQKEVPAREYGTCVNRFDHVLLGVRDLHAAAARLRRDFGLGSRPGGTPAPGLLNMVVPLQPPTYLELITVTDSAASGPAGRLADRIAGGDRLFTWAIVPDDIASEAARLGREAIAGGVDTGRWHLLGDVGPELPFFIDYGAPRERLATGWSDAYAKAKHECAPGPVTYLVISGDDSAVREWVGDVDIPLRFVHGTDGLVGVGIATAHGEIVIR
jgi:hypothetical protein